MYLSENYPENSLMNLLKGDDVIKNLNSSQGRRYRGKWWLPDYNPGNEEMMLLLRATVAQWQCAPQLATCGWRGLLLHCFGLLLQLLLSQLSALLRSIVFINLYCIELNRPRCLFKTQQKGNMWKSGVGVNWKGVVCPGFVVGGCSFEQLPYFGILSDAPGGLVKACVWVGGPCEGDIEHFDKVHQGLRSVGECGSVGYWALWQSSGGPEECGMWERTLKD